MESSLRSLSVGLLVTLSIVILSACGSGQKTKPGEIAIDSIDYQTSDSLQVKDSLTLLYSTKLHYEFPQEPKLIAQFNRLVFSFDGADSMSVAQIKQKYINNYQTQLRDTTGMGNEPMESSFTLYSNEELINKILYQDEQIISSSVYTYSYGGGAHGMYSFHHFSLLKKDARQILESDLFVAGSEQELNNIILQELMKQFKVKTPEELEDVGFFDYKEIKANGNFSLDNQGIHYSYSPYELAAYAVGVVDVFIPYSAVESILLPDTFVRQYLK